MADIYNLTDTWNAGGTTFTAIKMDVTDTASAAASALLDLQVGASSKFKITKAGNIVGPSGVVTTWTGPSAVSFDVTVYFGNTTAAASRMSARADVGFVVKSDYGYLFSSTTGANGAADSSLFRIGAGVVGVRGATVSAGAALNFLEQTAPSAPAANQVVLYAVDNGGKTALMALFPSGSAQQVAIEP